MASPIASIASSLPETIGFFRSHGGNMVLKPLAGSGSELLFHCRDESDVTKAVTILEEELPKRRENPLFRPFPNPAGDSLIDPCSCWVAEEFISGPEFSCDFVLQDGEVFFIRETGKIKAKDKPFGSVLAYTFPPRYPAGFQKQVLKEVLKKATNSLGFDWGYFMVDYILHQGTPILIEMTPRPGGDSIPELVRAATGLDTLALYLDFVQGHFKETEEPLPSSGVLCESQFLRPYGRKDRGSRRQEGDSLPACEKAFLQETGRGQSDPPPKRL